MKTRKNPSTLPEPPPEEQRHPAARRRSSASASALQRDRARRARLWGEGKLSGKDWLDDSRAIPHLRESEQISIRLPKRLLTLLRTLAKRRSIGYQILLKDWLDDRAREEARRELGRSTGLTAETRLLVLKAAASLGVQPERLKDSADSQQHLVVRAAG
jgi:hypothetical protein